ncbi:MAG: abortive infection family protein [Deltaproteobacteria bacterium]|nr:abortive infection family protein [Deltaproteobacteria bacterium]
MTLQPTLSFRTMDAVSAVICGDNAVGCQELVSPYRSHARIYEFFHEDLKLQAPARLDGSRQWNAKAWLKSVNGTPDLVLVVEAAVRPCDYEGTDFDVAAVARHLNEFLKHDGLRLTASGNRWVLVSSGAVALPAPARIDDVLSDEYILEMEEKCDVRLAQDDFEGAVTTARTLLEATLREIERRISGSAGSHKGDLPRQFKQVAKLLKMDTERDDLDARFKDVVRGLVTVVAGLAPLRNRISDGHARVRKPAPHHARVVVNAAKTVAGFLLESYEFQRARGSVE